MKLPNCFPFYISCSCPCLLTWLLILSGRPALLGSVTHSMFLGCRPCGYPMLHVAHGWGADVGTTHTCGCNPRHVFSKTCGHCGLQNWLGIIGHCRWVLCWVWCIPSTLALPFSSFLASCCCCCSNFRRCCSLAFTVQMYSLPSVVVSSSVVVVVMQ